MATAGSTCAGALGPLSIRHGRAFSVECTDCANELSGIDRGSVRLELVPVVDLEGWILLGLAQHAIADDEKLDLVAHEAAEGVLGCADDRLAAHVEARVDQDAAAGLFLEARDQRMEARVGVGVHRLYTCRIVDVSDGGDI